jgi:hypothetical protein
VAVRPAEACAWFKCASVYQTKRLQTPALSCALAGLQPADISGAMAATRLARVRTLQHKCFSNVAHMKLGAGFVRNSSRHFASPPQVSGHRVDHPDVVSPRVRRWCDLAVFFRYRARVSCQLRTLHLAARCSEPSRAACLQLMRRCERVPLGVLPVACAHCFEPGNRCKAADRSSWMWVPMSPQRTRSRLHPAGQGGCPGHNHFSATQGPRGHPVVAAVYARYTQNRIVLAGAGLLPSCSWGACPGRRMRVSACLATGPAAWTHANTVCARRQTAGALRQVRLYNRSGA